MIKEIAFVKLVITYLFNTSLAQSDARPTGNQGFAGSIPTGSGNSLLWRLTVKYFLRSFSPFRWFKKEVVSFWHKKEYKYC